MIRKTGVRSQEAAGIGPGDPAVGENEAERRRQRLLRKESNKERKLPHGL
jgi:hypothetical protein